MPREALFLLLAAWPAWADSQVCAGCHRRIYDTWLKNPMARSLARPAGEGPGSPITVYNRATDRYYQVLRHVQSESQFSLDGKPVFRVSYPVEYVVGSGKTGHTYIVRREGELFQAPLSFYTRTQSWDLSPGYERQDQGFNRPIVPVCISCHAGFRGQGIGCEDCHGPGEAHASSSGKGAIVNPARLPNRLGEEICMRCHQDGDVRVLQPGKTDADYRPGRPLSETVALFKIPGTDSGDLLEHHYAMRLSKCFTASGGKLGCLTCHRPHAPADYRAACLGCHRAAACKLALASRGPADDCVSCHMPKREARQVSHAALTLHRIVRSLGQPEPAVTPNLPDLIYVNGAPGELPAVTLLQAYAQLLDRRPAFQARYLELLDQARRTDPKHPFVLAALGRKALRAGDPKAVEYLSEAVAAGAISAVPYQDLAEALTRAGRLAEAVQVLKQGLERFPFAAVLHKLLASRYIDLRQYPAARQAITRYLDLFPEDGFMREMLHKFDAAAYSNRSISPR